MHPTFSVIFLTTLIGVGQGLFLAIFTEQSYSTVNLLPAQESSFYVTGSLLALAFMVGGLFAAVFHLGKPSYFITRAWRGVTQWRTSWLSRELIALPLVMGLMFLYMVFHYFGWDADIFGSAETKGQLTLVIGGLGSAAVFILFVATGMIYASLKFLQEWNCSLTVFNYILFGGASGFTLAAAYSAFAAPELVAFYASWAMIITLAALVSRAMSLFRNARIKYKSTLQTAIGVRHTQIQQKAMGMMGGSYNTREYFHGKTAIFLKSIKWIFLVLVFPLPLLLLWLGMDGNPQALVLAFAIQYLGLLFERWFFFAQANHPQNLYYQTV
ncbi:DMSO reductase [Solemya pervernicosa gill symbiont]|uniref:DMSO reductase n=2 Tax=Gammaproteobacteria incertae sedis TaxID=118884 RepID=A0A1T2LAJ2_9GAMM|nr:DmsC/YnfH family molybdoenzyme membrane anchor subunit [Candidatus Reidiella endopervernicosa]OOZ41966.1 DMSO reductase [Solemya pervernicosa gill symbiont]QKQ24935.1 dimethyl sulfoxide reductase anchor subunit [Candidatus Reidiella endopervernicosa]